MIMKRKNQVGVNQTAEKKGLQNVSQKRKKEDMEEKEGLQNVSQERKNEDTEENIKIINEQLDYLYIQQNSTPQH